MRCTLPTLAILTQLLNMVTAIPFAGSPPQLTFGLASAQPCIPGFALKSLMVGICVAAILLRRWSRQSRLLAITAASALLMPVAAAAAEFRGLGGNGIVAVTDNGIAIGLQTNHIGNVAYPSPSRWQAGAWTDLNWHSFSAFSGPPPGVQVVYPASVYAVSGNGEVVVGNDQGPGVYGGQPFFRADPIFGMDFGIAKGSPGTFTAVSADGLTIAGNENDSSGQLVRWSSEKGFEPLGASGYVRAMSSDGSVMVGSLLDQGRGGRAFRWTAEKGFEPVGLPDVSFVAGVAADGGTIVGWTEGQSWLWNIARGTIPIHEAFTPAALSGNGVTVYGVREDNEPIVWDGWRGPRDLSKVLAEQHQLGEALDGWKLQTVSALSPDGLTLAGSGLAPSGQQESWLVTLDFEPLPTAMLPGDSNLDGAIDLTDFGTLKANFGAGHFWYEGDFSGDYRVNLADFGILKANFGKSAAGVPEPASLALLALAGAALYMVRLSTSKRRASR